MNQISPDFLLSSSDNNHYHYYIISLLWLSISVKLIILWYYISKYITCIVLLQSIFLKQWFFSKHSLCVKALCLHGTQCSERLLLNTLGCQGLPGLFSYVWYMLCGNLTQVCCGDSVLTPAPLCLSLSACPHRSTLPKSGYRKYGPPSVQLAHDLTLWQLDFHSLYCVCFSVCVCDLENLMTFEFNMFFFPSLF